MYAIYLFTSTASRMTVKKKFILLLYYTIHIIFDDSADGIILK